MKKKIVSWLKQQVKIARAKGLILGLSGGIDSCVVAALAKEAVGKGRVLALTLPIHSHSQDIKDAKDFARKAGIKVRTIDLSPLYDRFMKLLPEANRLAYANLKPRLRMVTIYYFANKLNYLVCGTGNRSELSVGYFTKYGDGAADLLPIGCLLKKEVVKLAQELKVPQRIIQKPPSAGLWHGQTDEDEMGITYRQLDDILERMEKGKRQSAAAAKVRKVKQMVRASEHKRQGIKVCKV